MGRNSEDKRKRRAARKQRKARKQRRPPDLPPDPPNGVYLGSFPREAVFTNPIWAGVGPFPSRISDSQWVEGAALLMDEEGPEAYIEQYLGHLRGNLGAVPDASFLESGVQAYQADGPKAVVLDCLQIARVVWEQMPPEQQERVHQAIAKRDGA
jgi:hypothetical protein